jgi:predicted ester cyclase
MTAEENKALARRFVEEVINGNNLAVVDELFAPNFEVRDAVFPVPPGPDGVKQVFVAARAAFPDLHETIEDLLAEEDRVMVRWSSRGTRGRSPASRRPGRRSCGAASSSCGWRAGSSWRCGRCMTNSAAPATRRDGRGTGLSFLVAEGDRIAWRWSMRGSRRAAEWASLRPGGR